MIQSRYYMVNNGNDLNNYQMYLFRIITLDDHIDNITESLKHLPQVCFIDYLHLCLMQKGKRKSYNGLLYHSYIIISEEANMHRLNTTSYPCIPFDSVSVHCTNFHSANRRYYTIDIYAIFPKQQT